MKKNFFQAALSSPKSILKSVMLIVIFSFIACDENYTVKHEKVENVDFKKFKTYAWLPVMDSVTVWGIDRQQLNNAIFSNIEEQLMERKITIDTVKPDILVRYSVMVNNSISVVNTPIYDYRPTMTYGMGYGYYGGYGSVGVYNQPVQVGTEVRQVPFRNGQLVIDVIDHSTNKVVWRGYAYGSREEDNVSAPIDKMRKRLKTIINDIFWYYPVKR